MRRNDRLLLTGQRKEEVGCLLIKGHAISQSRLFFVFLFSFFLLFVVQLIVLFIVHSFVYLLNLKSWHQSQGSMSLVATSLAAMRAPSRACKKMKLFMVCLLPL
jgi:pheromone shutdown protein TraB